MDHEQVFFEKVWHNVGDWKNQGGAYRKKVPDTIVLDFIEFLKEQKIRRGFALDIGCGGGRHVVELTNAGFKTTGIDYAPSAIELAKKLTKEKNINAELFAADFLKFKTDKEFKVILDIGCLHHLRKKDWNKFRNQIYRLLKDDGYFCLVVLSSECKGIRGYSSGNTKTYVLDNGHYTKFFTKDELIKLFAPYFEIEEFFQVPRGKSKEFHILYMKKKIE